MLYHKFNDELCEVSYRLQVNTVSLNVNKTCYMMIFERVIREQEMNECNEEIKRSNHDKFQEVRDDQIFFSQNVINNVKEIS